MDDECPPVPDRIGIGYCPDRDGGFCLHAIVRYGGTALEYTWHPDGLIVTVL